LCLINQQESVVYRILQQRLENIVKNNAAASLRERKIGLEKECLRVNNNGTISQTQHPIALGSALTNRYITTDYSESLLEFITPPYHTTAEVLNTLNIIHKFVYSKLENEILWSTSMPCVLTGNDSIRIAEYGQSNAGVMKTVYRRGLGHRYGKMMQVIAGIHFNFSLPDSFWNQYQILEKNSAPARDFKSDSYFNMLRNLQRYGWIIPYLFGASPAVCTSFMDGIAQVLEPFDDYTYHHPYATSLRLSDIGYQNYKEGKSGIKANYDSLDAYIASLKYAIETPSPEYHKFGIKVNGVYQQLNSNLLQIENEYYSSVRPKQITGKFEKPSTALRQRGIEYIELRSLDVNVFEPLGINESQLHFLELFLVFCLLHDSPKINDQERHEIDTNQSNTAHHGRQPGLELIRNGSAINLRSWGHEIFEAMTLVCDLFDSSDQPPVYRQALERYIALLDAPELTPSARILKQMSDNKQAFAPFSLDYAKQHAHYFAALPISHEAMQFLETEADKSIAEQRRLEASDKLSFDEFLLRYFAGTLNSDSA